MKKLLRQLPKALLLLLVMLVFVQANAQKRLSPVAVTDFKCLLMNDVQTGGNTLEFDVYLWHNDPLTSLEIGGVQLGILINQACLAGGTPSIVMTSTEMTGGLAIQPLPLYYVTGTTCEFKCGQANNPGCGLGVTISTTYPGTLYAHYKITNSVNFLANSLANLSFNFSTSNGLSATKISYYPHPCPSSILAITSNSSNCLRDATYWHNVILNPSTAPTLYTVSGGGSYCELGAGLPVNLSGSQSGVAYWLYANGIITSQFKNGTGSALVFNRTVQLKDTWSKINK